jgi:hypothetical protein
MIGQQKLRVTRNIAH